MMQRPKWLPAGENSSPQQRINIVSHSSKTDVVTAWVQIFTVMLLAVGLYFSVYPAYQKELLEERSAQLTLEVEEQRFEARTARIEKEIVEAKIEGARSRLYSLEQLIAAQSAAADEIERERRKALDSLDASQTQYDLLVAASEKVAWSVFSTVLVDSLERAGRQGSLGSLISQDPYDFLNIGVDELKAAFEIDLWEAIEDAMTYVGSTSLGSAIRDLVELEDLSGRARSILEPYRKSFLCPQTDAEMWRSAAQRLLEQMDDAVEDCVQRAWDDRADKKDWSRRELMEERQSEFGIRQSDQYSEWCRNSYRRSASATFFYHVAGVRHDCISRLHQVGLILRGDTPVPNQDSLEMLMPPELTIVPQPVGPSQRGLNE